MRKTSFAFMVAAQITGVAEAQDYNFKDKSIKLTMPTTVIFSNGKSVEMLNDVFVYFAKNRTRFVNINSTKSEGIALNDGLESAERFVRGNYYKAKILYERYGFNITTSFRDKDFTQEVDWHVVISNKSCSVKGDFRLDNHSRSADDFRIKRTEPATCQIFDGRRLY